MITLSCTCSFGIEGFVIFCLNLILSKLYMNAVIMKDPHLQEDGHDLKGHERSHEACVAKFFQAHSFMNQI